MIDVDLSGVTKEDCDSMVKVADRAQALGLVFGRSRMTLIMDLEFAHVDCGGLNWDTLLNFGDLDFAHDMHGIAVNINRETGKLNNCFLPRATKH